MADKVQDATIRARVAIESTVADASTRTAERLRSMGFSIVSASKFGVDIRGSVDQYERAFGTSLAKSDRGWQFAKDPKITGDLADDAASVYFPTRPEYHP